MPQQQFDLLMKVLAAAADGSTVRISGADKNLLTPEVQQEFLNLQALLGSLAAGHEDRAAYVWSSLEMASTSRARLPWSPWGWPPAPTSCARSAAGWTRSISNALANAGRDTALRAATEQGPRPKPRVSRHILRSRRMTAND